MRNSIAPIVYPARHSAGRALLRLRAHVANCLLGGKYQVTPEGLIIGGGLRAVGRYFHRIREREPEFTMDPNLVVDQGILKILGIAYFTDAKINAYYLALTKGSTAVTGGLTAANFAATQDEITSTSEGYTAATRPAYVPAAPVAGIITNAANKASYTIATAASVTITGCGLLSDNGRGSTAGFLMSASQFANGRELFNGETFDLAYQTSLTD